MLNYTLAFLLLLSACAPSLPVVKKDALSMPGSFPSIESERGASPAVSSQVIWNSFFRDPTLNSLINTALTSNQELRILDQQINIANNEILARSGEPLPKFNANVNGGIEKTERFSTEDANGPLKFGRAGISATWEIDIWKKLRNATKSAYFEYLATVEGRRYMVTNLVSEIANTYFDLMAYDNQLETVNSYIEILQKIKSFVQYQQTAGRVTTLPVKRFEAELLKIQARKYELHQNITVTENKLNALLGRFPTELKRNSKNFAQIHLSPVGPSVPVKLLENRPDIRRATLELEAAKLDVEVAKARFYPSIAIDGGAGYENFNSRHFENPAVTSFYSLVGNITAPLLNRRAIKADYYTANNKQIQAVYDYEKTLIDAYSDVVNNLNMIKNYDMIYDLKSQQVKALQESIEISNTLFKAARVDYVEALFTQRDALEAQIELVDVKKQMLSAHVNLYKALGGGWRGTKENLDKNYYE